MWCICGCPPRPNRGGERAMAHPSLALGALRAAGSFGVNPAVLADWVKAWSLGSAATGQGAAEGVPQAPPARRPAPSRGAR